MTRHLKHITYHNLIWIDIFIYDYYLSDMEIHPGTHEVFLISEVDKECQLSQINYNNNLKKKKAVVFCKRLQAWSLQLVPSRKAFEEISNAKEKSVIFRKGYEKQSV